MTDYRDRPSRHVTREPSHGAPPSYGRLSGRRAVTQQRYTSPESRGGRARARLPVFWAAERASLSAASDNMAADADGPMRRSAERRRAGHLSSELRARCFGAPPRLCVGVCPCPRLSDCAARRCRLPSGLGRTISAHAPARRQRRRSRRGGVWPTSRPTVAALSPRQRHSASPCCHPIHPREIDIRHGPAPGALSAPRQ